MGLFSSSSTQQTSGTTQGTTNPLLSPELQSFLSGLVGITGGLQKSVPSTDQLVGQQTQKINQNAGVASKGADAIMAARGLSTSPVAATTQAGIDANRIGQITTAQEQAPYEQQQLQLQALSPMMTLASLYPHGQSTTGTIDQTTKASSTPSFLSILGQLIGGGMGIGSLFGGGTKGPATDDGYFGG
jgi:hypothetical protein